MKPEISEKINGYQLKWGDTHITIDVSRLNVKSDGRVLAELVIKNSNAVLLPPTQINLSADRTRKDLIKNLKEKYTKYDWQSIVDQLAWNIQDIARRGESVSEILASSDDEIEPPEFLLYPLVMEGLPTILFGEKGVSKSTMSMLINICLGLPWYDNPFGFETKQESAKTLILDWEQEKNIVHYYANRLQRGMDIPPFPILYRRCHAPLTEDIEQIKQHIDDTNAKCLIIDSLGAAAGGDLKDPKSALGFFASLRKLKVASLILAQTSKGDDGKGKTIFGSTYFTYYARSIFEMCKSQNSDEDSIQVGLFHRWSNYTKLEKPMGFNLRYNEDTSIKVERASLNMSEFFTKLSNQDRIMDFLKTNGQKSNKEIMDALGLTRSATDTSLSRMKDRGKVVKIGDKWGVLAQYEM